MEVDNIERYIRDNNYICQYDKTNRKILKDRDFNYYEAIKKGNKWIINNYEMEKSIDYMNYRLIKEDVKKYVEENNIDESKISDVRIEMQGYNYNKIMEEYVSGVSYEELCMYRLYVDREGEMIFRREKGEIKIIIDSKEIKI